MATAVFNEELATVQDTKIRMERRHNMTYNGLTCHKAAQGYCVVTGTPLEIMFLIGEMAVEGFDSLERFTL